MAVHAREVTVVLLAAKLLTLQGCYQYAYHRPTPIRPYNEIAIDEQLPQQTTRWSYLWGLVNDAPWMPLTTDPVLPTCDGKGAGKVQVGLAWYSLPVMLVTLGIAVPSRITIYCTTYSKPAVGP